MMEKLLEQLIASLQFNSPFELLVYLGIGYLAYRNAYVGLNRHHTARDSIFMSLVFAALIGWPTFRLGAFISGLFQIPSSLNAIQIVISTLFSAGMAVSIGLFWRTVGKKRWQNFLAKWDIREDGIPSAWDSFILATHSREVWQIAVHTKTDGVFYMDDRTTYLNAPLEGVYLGTEGDIALVVDAIEKDGKIRTPKGVVDNYYGTRVTYIPASEIKRVEIRMK